MDDTVKVYDGIKIKNGTRITLIVLVIQAALVFLNLYLSNGYVSKTTYESDTKDLLLRRERLNDDLGKFAVELKGIVDHMQGDEKQDTHLEKLDQRIDKMDDRMRAQEQKR